MRESKRERERDEERAWPWRRRDGGFGREVGRQNGGHGLAIHHGEVESILIISFCLFFF